MCIEDLTLSRNLRYRYYVTNGIINIPADPSRVSVRIIAGDGSWVYLNAVMPPFSQTGGDPAFFPLGVTMNNFIGGITNLSTPPDDITLEKVGEILKGPLQLYVASGDKGFAIETYQTIETPASLITNKLKPGEWYGGRQS